MDKEKLELLADTLDVIIHGLRLAIFSQDREAAAIQLRGLVAVQKQLRELSK